MFRPEAFLRASRVVEERSGVQGLPRRVRAAVVAIGNEPTVFCGPRLSMRLFEGSLGAGETDGIV